MSQPLTQAQKALQAVKVNRAIHALANWLLEGRGIALRQEGVFRKELQKNIIDDAQAAILNQTDGQYDPYADGDKAHYSPIGMAHLFKRLVKYYVQEQGYPLIHMAVWNAIKDSDGDASEQQAFYYAISNSPLLQQIVLLCQAADKHKEASLMDYANLAKLFTPLLLQYDSPLQMAQNVKSDGELLSKLLATDMSKLAVLSYVELPKALQVINAIQNAEYFEPLLLELRNELHRLAATEKGNQLLEALQGLEDTINLEADIAKALLDRASPLSRALNTHRNAIPLTFFGDRSVVSTDTRSYQKLLKLAESWQQRQSIGDEQDDWAFDSDVDSAEAVAPNDDGLENSMRL